MFKVLMFIIGAVFGSFYLVIATRLPKNEDVLTSRSRCDNCQHNLKWYNLIPILSYVFQKGKCSYCDKKISILNLIIELFTGLLFLIGNILYGFGYEYYIYLIIISLMIIIFVSDFLYMIILDSPLIIASVLIIILDLYYLGFIPTIKYIASAIILFLVMLLISNIGSKIFKKEALGGGDIKFAAVMGLVLGFDLGLVSLILSTFLALPYSIAALKLKKEHEIPYGPFLVGAMVIVFLFIDKFNNLLLYFTQLWN